MLNNSKIDKFTDNQWDVLFEYIAQRQVVPIIGPELLVAKDNGKEIPFYQCVTKRLVHYFNIEEIEGETIENLFTRLSINNIPINLSKTVMYKILKEMEYIEQPALNILASNPAFQLFLTTTPDSLLSKTITAVDREPDVYFYTPYLRHDNDLPSKNLQVDKRFVYHLYGKADLAWEYAITDEDRLIFYYNWMDFNYKPRNLLSYLADKYLLILGCGYDNWQVRFFLLGLKETKLFMNRNNMNYLLADSNSRSYEQLNHFLSNSNGKIYYEGGAVDFVNELYRRLKANPISIKNINAKSYEKGSIFISYASEDREYALRIKKKLESFSLPVWMDIENLKPGENFMKQINSNICNSSIFIPILSHSTTSTKEPRLFRQEWKIAAQEALKRASGIPFILPIAIDSVSPCENIPDIINKINWIYAPNGVLSECDVNHFIDLIAKM